MAVPAHDHLDSRSGVTAPTGRIIFILSLWMSLATAIICAIAPSGLPATRTVGSAFDPSTTIVALRSRPPVAKPALSQPDDDPCQGGRIDLVAPMASELAAFAAVYTATSGGARALRSSIPHPRALHIALYARPPPTV